MVSLPSPRLEPAVDAPLGDRGDENLLPRINRLDVLRHHLRRGARV